MRQSFNSIRHGVSPAAQVLMGQYENHAVSARRHRSNALYGGVQSPNTIEEMPDVIPPAFTTIGDENFLLWYEVHEEDDGSQVVLMIFGTI